MSYLLANMKLCLWWCHKSFWLQGLH